MTKEKRARMTNKRQSAVLNSAGVHPKIQNRRRKVAGAKNKRKLRWKLYPPIFLLLLGGATIWLLFYSPFLDLNKVQISGLTRTAPQEVSQITDQLLGDPIINANIADARQQILELPWVLDVEISRSWSDGRLNVSILERDPIAVLAAGTGYQLLDIEGKVLETLPAQQDFPRIEVFGLAETRSGWYETAQPALTVAKELLQSSDVSAKVQSVVQDEKGKLFLRLTTGGWVYLNDTRELNSKLRSMEAVLDEVQIKCTQILDINSPLAPVVTDNHNCQQIQL